MAFTVEVTEKVRQETSLDLHTWQATLSPQLGTIVWGAFVESLEELEAAQDKLAVSDQFTDLAEKGGALFDGPLADSLATVLHGQRDPGAPLPAYISSARATAANGRLGDAIAAGIEIAEAGTRITGIPTMFMMDATGPYGGCRWSTGFADIASLEQSQAALAADADWLALIDRVGTAYQSGASQAIFRRLV
jgi:hypothetical protein